MSWIPNDIDKFSQAYLAGASNMELATLFSSSYDKVNKYLGRCFDENTLPRRGTFTPTEETIIAAEEANGIDLKVLNKLKKSQSAIDVATLANEFDVSPKRIVEAVDRLRLQHYLVDTDGNVAKFARPTAGSSKIELKRDYIEANELVFGLVGDNHLCSKYERLDVLNALYDIFAEEGIRDVFNTGNWIDGEKFFNKNDIHTFGLGNQIDYFVAHYPSRAGITTHFIAGDDHEGWYFQSQGVDIGDYAESRAIKAGRTDLKYLGYMEHDVEIPAENGVTTIRVLHPGGGSAYALSYKTQKITESLNGTAKPDIMAVGHYHKAEYLHYQGVHIIQTGCTQDQTPFMRKNHISAHVGGWIVKARQAPDGTITRIRPEWISFDKSKWEHK